MNGTTVYLREKPKTTSLIVAPVKLLLGVADSDIATYTSHPINPIAIVVRMIIVAYRFMKYPPAPFRGDADAT